MNLKTKGPWAWNNRRLTLCYNTSIRELDQILPSTISEVPIRLSQLIHRMDG